MNKFEQERIEKVNKLREIGQDPYGSKYENIESMCNIVTEYTDEKEGTSVRVAGRIMTMRPHGKTAFLDIRDRTGKVQVYIKKDKVGEEKFEIFKLMDLGDIIGVDGDLFKTRTGEVTVYAMDFKLLSKAILPPPEKWHGLKDVELRYRQRYVDLFSNEKSMNTFLNRTKIIKWVREYLDNDDFIEVETPMMQPIAGGATAKPFITKHNTYDMDLYLRIAPELYLKRLLVGGMERIYEMNRNFRNEGVSTKHNPEFTMIEIYQAYSDYEGMMALTETMIASIAKKLYGSYKIPYGDLTLDLTTPWTKKKYSDLLKEYAGIDMGDRDAVLKKAAELNISIDDKGDDEIVNDIFEEVVEKELKMPTFVVDYPKSLCPLTKTCDDNPGFAQRFELYMASMELANAYTELNEPLEQADRFREQAGDCEVDGKVDEDFLHSLKYGMPPAGGLGIGIDRLVMLLTNTVSIRDVILFPLLRQ